MIKFFVQFVIAIFMVPVAAGITIAFYNNFLMINDLANSASYFLWGIVSYAVLHLLFYKPTYLYVLGHETVHAGVAWLFGGKIKSFKVSGDGGKVSTDKSNIFIELSPYFIPLYAIIVTVVYFVIASSYNINNATFIFLIGFALAFHLVSTIEVLKIRQPDLVKSGYFFSVVLVYIFNIVVISLIFGLIFPSFSLINCFTDFWRLSRNIYETAARQMFF